MDGQLTDVANVEAVEVHISADGNKLWVNVDGVCRLRVRGTKFIQVKDDRTKATLQQQYHARRKLETQGLISQFEAGLGKQVRYIGEEQIQCATTVAQKGRVGVLRSITYDEGTAWVRFDEHSGLHIPLELLEFCNEDAELIEAFSVITNHCQTGRHASGPPPTTALANWEDVQVGAEYAPEGHIVPEGTIKCRKANYDGYECLVNGEWLSDDTYTPKRVRLL